MKTKFSFVVVEDEPLQQENLVQMLQARFDLELLHCFDNAADAYDFLSSPDHEMPDLLFLDIEMPEANGLMLLESIKRLEQQPKVIITTAYEDYAIRSYDYEVSGYLLKPVETHKLFQAIDKAISSLASAQLEENHHLTSPTNNDSFFIKVDNRMVKILFDEIVCIEGANVQLKITTTYETYLTRQTLKNMQRILPGNEFLRVHDSFIIRWAYIKSYTRNFSSLELQWEGHEELLTIPVGKKYRDEFKQRMLGKG
jgi:two-component system LytT family response regulator